MRFARRLRSGLLALAALAPLVPTAGEAVAVAPREIAADVVVYGATAAGLTAAIQAARMGHDVIVVEASGHVGGMTTGGLSSSDVGKAWSIAGLASEFYARVGRAYGPNERQAFGADGRVFHFEPKLAQGVFDAWLREAGVELITNEPLDLAGGLVVKDGRIESIRSESGQVFRGRIFIDASFEGDVMAKAGVSYTVGREPESQYGESLAGLRRGDRKPRPHYTQGDKDHFTTAVDPYVKPGDPASGLLPGANWDYPEAEHAERRRIAAVHALYAKGVMWTLTNHPRVPESIRRVVSRHGWCKDEFVATGGLPPQLYVREGRRMLSDAVVTQGVCMGQEPCDDPAVCHDPGATARRRRGALRRRRPAVSPQAAGLVRKDD